MEITYEFLLLFFFVAAFAGFIDTLVGGGGLICIPALIIGGLPPLQALGTNKLQGSFGTLTATMMLLKHKRFKWSAIRAAFAMAFLGSALGTFLIQFLNPDLLSFVVPIVLGIICCYFFFAPPIKPTQQPKVSQKSYRYAVVPVIGGYDGMFGPGTGSFFTLAGVSLRAMDVIKATACAKPLNFATNLASLIVFSIGGHVYWIVGLTMMLGQVIGAWLGAHTLYKMSPKWLRALIVLICLIMLIKYCHSMGWLSFLP